MWERNFTHNYTNLQLKLGINCIPDDKIPDITLLSRYVYEIANISPYDKDPYVGKSHCHTRLNHADAVSRIL